MKTYRRAREAALRATADRCQRIIDAMHGRGVRHFIGRSVFSYAHEGAHGVDFGLDVFDSVAIDDRLMDMSLDDRLAREATVIAATFRICGAHDVVPPDTNPQSIAIGVWGNPDVVRGRPRWACSEYADMIVEEMTSDRARVIADAVLGIVKGAP